MPLEFNNSYFAAIAEASQDVMRILELDGTVEYMNPRGLELLEITAFERNKGKAWSDLWPAETREVLLAALETARLGQASRFDGSCPTATGKPRWWSTIVSPIQDANGRVVRLLATSRDVTAEHRREERLRRAVRNARRANAERAAYLAYLQAALEILPAGLAIYDPEDRLVVWNRGYAAAGAGAGDPPLRRGLSFAELLRADLLAGRHPDAAGREEEWLVERLADRRGDDAPREQQLAGGKWYRFEDRSLPDGGVVAVAIDISELKAREATAHDHAAQLAEAAVAVEAASKAKSQFLANMSHEIRTPLNGIIAVADLLCRSPLGPEEHRLAEIIRASGETLERLLSDILDLSRIESGAVSIESAPFQLGDLARGVMSLVRLKADEKGITLALELDPSVEGGFIGDSTRIRQVLTNLVGNAVKFTDAGEVRLTIRSVDAGKVRLEVQDTGIGFEPSEKERLFRRFEQADGTITRQYGGSGLGLSICQQLAILMGGDLDCTSGPGSGSSFWVDLPLTPDHAAAAPEAVEPVQPVLDGPLRVLVADDHPTNRLVVDLMLRGLGAEPLCVENGAEAVEAWRMSQYDIVLMDMQMPVMDGLAAVREIRSGERLDHRRPVPILMLTANTLPEHVAAARDAGCDGHLAKPITADRLLSAIADVLNSAQAELSSGPVSADLTG